MEKEGETYRNERSRCSAMWRPAGLAKRMESLISSVVRGFHFCFVLFCFSEGLESHWRALSNHDPVDQRKSMPTGLRREDWRQSNSIRGHCSYRGRKWGRQRAGAGAEVLRIEKHQDIPGRCGPGSQRKEAKAVSGLSIQSPGNWWLWCLLDI